MTRQKSQKSSKIVRSPMLVPDEWGNLAPKRGDQTHIAYVCIELLSEFLEFPEDAAAFRLEGSLRQWPDRSGCVVWLKVKPEKAGYGVEYLYAKSSQSSKDKWRLFYAPIDRDIKKLVGVPEKPVRVYFRLLYDE